MGIGSRLYAVPSLSALEPANPATILSFCGAKPAGLFFTVVIIAVELVFSDLSYDYLLIFVLLLETFAFMHLGIYPSSSASDARVFVTRKATLAGATVILNPKLSKPV